MKLLKTKMPLSALLLFVAGYVGQMAVSADVFAEEAFKIFGKSTSIEDLMKIEQDKFYQLDNERYQLVEGLAKQVYLEAYFARIGEKQKMTADAARNAYMEKNSKFSESEFKETFAKYKDHPKLKTLSKAEQETQIKNLLRVKGEQELVQKIILDGLNSGDLKISQVRPTEPIYKMVVTKDDHVRYSPDDQTATKPQGCSGDDCAVTIIEYSEYQCPFCARVIPTTTQILKEYKGKVRWVTRDFPLDFHDRAKPAAIAAKCASYQDKFWPMYAVLFDNQRNLSDESLKGFAEKIGLDKEKFSACYEKPEKALAVINENIRTGAAVGVTGTPAFFINGRRLSGALPFEEFKQVIDSELAKVGNKTAKKT